MTVPGSVALGAAGGAAAAAAAVAAGSWLGPADVAVALLLALIVVGLPAITRLDPDRLVAAMGWWIVGLVLAIIAATPLLGSHVRVSTSGLGWEAGIYVGVAVAFFATTRPGPARGAGWSNT